MEIISIAIMAIVIEGLITWFDVFKKEGVQAKLVASIFIGMFVAIVYNIDMMQHLGYNSLLPFVGNILTGLGLARGSNYIFDLWGRITKVRVKQESDGDIYS